MMHSSQRLMGKTGTHHTLITWRTTLSSHSLHGNALHYGLCDFTACLTGNNTHYLYNHAMQATLGSLRATTGCSMAAHWHISQIACSYNAHAGRCGGMCTAALLHTSQAGHAELSACFRVAIQDAPHLSHWSSKLSASSSFLYALRVSRMSAILPDTTE